MLKRRTLSTQCVYTTQVASRAERIRAQRRQPTSRQPATTFIMKEGTMVDPMCMWPPRLYIDYIV